MTLRFYFDENFVDGRVVRALRARGISIITVFEVGLAGRADEEHLAFATANGRVVVTSDEDDFERISARLLAAGGTHTGIIVVQQSAFGIGAIVNGLERAAAAQEESLRDQVAYLGHWARRS